MLYTSQRSIPNISVGLFTYFLQRTSILSIFLSRRDHKESVIIITGVLLLSKVWRNEESQNYSTYAKLCAIWPDLLGIRVAALVRVGSAVWGGGGHWLGSGLTHPFFWSLLMFAGRQADRNANKNDRWSQIKLLCRTQTSKQGSLRSWGKVRRV